MYNSFHLWVSSKGKDKCCTSAKAKRYDLGKSVRLLLQFGWCSHVGLTLAGRPINLIQAPTREGWILLNRQSKRLFDTVTPRLVQLHPESLQPLSRNEWKTGLNQGESKWAGRRNRGQLGWLCVLGSWERYCRLIFLPAHKCFGLILVTRYRLIANKVIVMLVAYFLMADIRILIS